MPLSRKLGRVYAPQVLPQHARLSAMLSPSLPDPPTVYDVDANLPRGLAPPLLMDGNDVHSDCVLASQGKILRRFLADEYGTLIAVTQQEIESAYFAETGGADDGLVVEDSLQSWITDGWVGGGQFRKIAAFARVGVSNRRDVQLGISLLSGLIIGVQLPQGWMDANESGDAWDVPPSDPTIVGGHAMWVSAYDADGVTVETWGTRQKMTWAALEWAASEDNGGRRGAGHCTAER
jgi:hypothetical protein